MTMSAFSWATRVVATKVVATDGTGDFTDIQSAINALPAGGGSVYIKEGTYTITSTITINKSNVSLFGAGKSTKIQTTSDIPMISATSKSSLAIEDLYLYGAGTGKTNNRGIDFTTVTNSRIKGVWLENCGENVIIFDNNSADIQIISCFVSNNFNSAIRIDESDHFTVSSCNLVGNDGAGIDLSTCDSILVNNCNIYNNKNHGIYFAVACHHSVISNCVIANNDYDNTATYDGICINSNCDANIIIGNNITNNDRYEVHIVLDTCQNNMVIGNICAGSDHEDTIVDNGTDTQRGHNITTIPAGGGGSGGYHISSW